MKRSTASLQAPAKPSAEPTRRIGLDALQNTMLRKAITIWEGASGDRLPGRGDISLKHMTGLLRNTTLVRVLKDSEFEMRIVGDAIVQGQGTSLQGLTTAQIDARLPGYGSFLRRVYGQLCKEASPAAYRGWFRRDADGRLLYHETVLLPLAGDGRSVDHILVVTVYAAEFAQPDADAAHGKD
jgi:hypothetical protein